MHVASYIEGDPLMWMMPLDLHVNQKSDYDMMNHLEQNNVPVNSSTANCD